MSPEKKLFVEIDKMDAEVIALIDAWKKRGCKLELIASQLLMFGAGMSAKLGIPPAAPLNRVAGAYNGDLSLDFQGQVAHCCSTDLPS